MEPGSREPPEGQPSPEWTVSKGGRWDEKPSLDREGARRADGMNNLP